MAGSADGCAEDTAPSSLLDRLASRIGIAPEGVLIALPVVGVGLALAAFGLHAAAIIVIAIGGILAAFFRDPQRHAIAAADAVVSGADGRICDISVASLPGID